MVVPHGYYNSGLETPYTRVQTISVHAQVVASYTKSPKLANQLFMYILFYCCLKTAPSIFKKIERSPKLTKNGPVIASVSVSGPCVPSHRCPMVRERKPYTHINFILECPPPWFNALLFRIKSSFPDIPRVYTFHVF